MTKKILLATALTVGFVFGWVACGDAANWYVRVGATGANTGTNWTDAWPGWGLLNWPSVAFRRQYLRSWRRYRLVFKLLFTEQHHQESGHQNNQTENGARALVRNLQHYRLFGIDDLTDESAGASISCSTPLPVAPAATFVLTDPPPYLPCYQASSRDAASRSGAL